MEQLTRRQGKLRKWHQPLSARESPLRGVAKSSLLGHLCSCPAEVLALRSGMDASVAISKMWEPVVPKAARNQGFSLPNVHGPA